MSNEIELNPTPKGSADLSSLPQGNVILDSLPKGCIPVEVPPASQYAIYLDGVKDVYNKVIEFSKQVQDIENLANDAKASAIQINADKENVAQNTALAGQYLNNIINKANEVSTNTTTVTNKANEVATNTAHVDEYYNKIKDIIPEGYAELVTEVGNKSNKSYVDNELAKKADTATTLSGYGITDAYTKDETNTLLNTKANSADVNNALALKANSADVYSKMQVDRALGGKVNKSGDTMSGRLIQEELSIHKKDIIGRNLTKYFTIGAENESGSVAGAFVRMFAPDSNEDAGTARIQANKVGASSYLRLLPSKEIVGDVNKLLIPAVLTLEEIEASTDLSGKVASASAVKNMGARYIDSVVEEGYSNIVQNKNQWEYHGRKIIIPSGYFGIITAKAAYSEYPPSGVTVTKSRTNPNSNNLSYDFTLDKYPQDNFVRTITAIAGAGEYFLWSLYGENNVHFGEEMYAVLIKI